MPPFLVPGSMVACDRFVTRLISVINQSPRDLEDRLGYNRGRLSRGWALLLLKEPIAGGEFQFAGYTHLSGGRVGHPSLGDTRPTVHDDLQRLLGDPSGYADQFARENFPLSGPERIVKIIPATAPDSGLSDADRYPVGRGIPQWILTVKKKFLVAVVVRPGLTHLGGGIDLPSGFWIDPATAIRL